MVTKWSFHTQHDVPFWAALSHKRYCLQTACCVSYVHTNVYLVTRKRVQFMCAGYRNINSENIYRREINVWPVHSGISQIAKPLSMDCIVTTWQTVSLYVSTFFPESNSSKRLWPRSPGTEGVQSRNFVGLSMVLTGCTDYVALHIRAEQGTWHNITGRLFTAINRDI